MIPFFQKKNTYHRFAKWLDRTLCQPLPRELAAFCFNLYDDGDHHWSVELIGTPTFEESNEAWTYSHVFSNRKDPFFWVEKKRWQEILQEIKDFVMRYLEHGDYASVLRAHQGVAIGFVDGNLQLLYRKKNKTANQ